MVVLTHPTGNAFVRQALAALNERNMLTAFYTTLSWNCNSVWNKLLPRNLSSELNRRAYPGIPRSLVHLTPAREAMRLLASRMGLSSLVDGENSPLSIKRVCNFLDLATARTIRERPPNAVYAYEGASLHTFREAHRKGTLCIYELPSGYWYYEKDLLLEEAELRPEYASTIAKLKDSAEYLRRCDEELFLADLIIVPSHYIERTLERSPISTTLIRVVPYGAPEIRHPVRQSRHRDKLKVIFVGSLTQRKGIGYLIDAVKMMGSSVEFTMIGTKPADCAALNSAVREHRWIESAPHSSVLSEIARNDVLVLPSLAEGFGLVISEALSCGVPVITTHNTGAPEIISEGREGFFVPIRSAEAIAQRLEMLASDRNLLNAMSDAALSRAQECTWQKYRQLLAASIVEVLPPVIDCKGV